jgi:hypothetical protein
VDYNKLPIAPGLAPASHTARFSTEHYRASRCTTLVIRVDFTGCWKVLQPYASRYSAKSFICCKTALAHRMLFIRADEVAQ